MVNILEKLVLEGIKKDYINKGYFDIDGNLKKCYKCGNNTEFNNKEFYDGARTITYCSTCDTELFGCFFGLKEAYINGIVIDF